MSLAAVSSIPRERIDKYLFSIKLAHRRSVSALDVVSKYLQLRFGVNGCSIREQKGLIGLLGICLLRILPNKDLAVEYPFRLAVENRFVELVACTIRLRMVDGGVVVDDLRARPQGESVQRAFAPLRIQHNRHIIAHNRPAHSDGIRSELCLFPEFGLNHRHMERLQTLILKLVVLYDSLITNHNLRHCIGQVRLIRQRNIAFDDRDPTPAADNHQVPGGNEEWLFLGGYEKELDRIVQDYSVRNKNKGAILKESGIEGDKRGFIDLHLPGEERQNIGIR